MRYWSTPPHTELAQTERWLEAMIAGTGDDFVVCLGEQVIGKVGLYRAPEIGYIIHPDFSGKGYATEAVRAVVDMALHHRGLAAVIADVDPRNEASLRLLERLGFVETHRATATIQVGDELCDSVYLAVNSAQFRARASAQ